MDEDKIEEDLLCMVCSRPFVEPTEHINCGKEFCRSCIEKVASCPNCRSEVNGHTRAITLKRLLNPLNDLKVICPRCDGQFTRGDLAMHLLKCVKGLSDAFANIFRLSKRLWQAVFTKGTYNARSSLWP